MCILTCPCFRTGKGMIYLITFQMDSFINAQLIATDGFHRTRKKTILQRWPSRELRELTPITIHCTEEVSENTVNQVLSGTMSLSLSSFTNFWIYMMHTNIKVLYLGSSGLRPLLRVGAWRNSGLRDRNCYIRINLASAGTTYEHSSY